MGDDIGEFSRARSSASSSHDFLLPLLPERAKGTRMMMYVGAQEILWKYLGTFYSLHRNSTANTTQ